MRPRGSLLLAAAIVMPMLTALGTAPSVSADPVGTGCKINPRLCVRIEDLKPGRPTPQPQPSPQPSPKPAPKPSGQQTARKGKPSPYRWARQYDVDVVGGNVITPGCDPGRPVPPGQYAIPYYDYLYDTRNGQVIDTTNPAGCYVGPWPRTPGTPEPPMPPEPPSYDEVWDEAPIPPPSFSVSPNERGLTGLETWLWADPTSAASVSASIRGYTATANARTASYRWILGDGTVATSTGPGSEQDPAVRYVYERRDTYTITLEVIWTGTFTFEGNGVPLLSDDLGEASLSESRPYNVVEIRSVLERPGSVTPTQSYGSDRW